MPWHNSMEKFISAQYNQWQKQKEKIDETAVEKPHPFVTISREYGSGGYDIAEQMTTLLNGEKDSNTWAAYDRKLLGKIMDDMGFTRSLTETMTGNARKSMTNLIQTSFSSFPPQVAVYRKLVETIRLLVINGHVIIVGRAGNVITRDLPGGLHVRIIAPMDYKVERMMSLTGKNRKDAEKMIKEKSVERDSFMKKYVKFDPADAGNFDLIINNARYSSHEAAQLIVSSMKVKGII